MLTQDAPPTCSSVPVVRNGVATKYFNNYCMKVVRCVFLSVSGPHFAQEARVPRRLAPD